jgi:hypothetical protein
MASKGSVSATPTCRRRVMLTSSGLAEFTATVRGSSAMPQMGHVPGPSRTICGCMGQVYSVRSVAVGGSVASSAIPHLGQAPGFPECTSGCMGQVYWLRAGAFVSEPTATGAAPCEPSYLPGSASNFVRHPAEQKYQVCPACSTDAAASCGNTFMPHTGSIFVRSASAMLHL